MEGLVWSDAGYKPGQMSVVVASFRVVVNGKWILHIVLLYVLGEKSAGVPVSEKTKSSR
jgi:hypothetical protein